MKTIDKLVFLNSFPPPTHLNIPCRALFFFFPPHQGKNLFLHFPEGFSSELFCTMEWAKSECFVADGCTVHTLQYTGCFIRGAGAGTAEPTQVRVCRKKRNSPKKPNPDQGCEWGKAGTETQCQSEECRQILLRDTPFEKLKKNGNLVLTLQNLQNLSDLTLGCSSERTRLWFALFEERHPGLWSSSGLSPASSKPTECCRI